VADIAFFRAAIAVPGTFVGIDLVEAALHGVAPGRVIEHEELVLGPEERGIRDAGRLQVRLGTLRE
jgi:hypothetical protein